MELGLFSRLLLLFFCFALFSLFYIFRLDSHSRPISLSSSDCVDPSSHRTDSLFSLFASASRFSPSSSSSLVSDFILLQDAESQVPRQSVWMFFWLSVDEHIFLVELFPFCFSHFIVLSSLHSSFFSFHVEKIYEFFINSIPHAGLK